MARYNFFERMEREINFQFEYEKIENIILNETNGYHTLEDEISENFRRWRLRKNFDSFLELKEYLGFKTEKILKGYTVAWKATGEVKSVDTFILYCEMIINMIFGVIEPDLQSHYRKCINAVQSLIDYDLEQINHYIYRTEDGKYLVVQKDAAASAVADIVAPELADAIIEYNHHLLKGDLKSKKLILKQIADALEPRRAELKTVNKTIENDFFYMVNTMNVRHNNCDVSDPSKYNEKFANLTDREKEEWYDEIYQEGLMAYLSLEQVDREKKILDFKTKQKK